MQLLGRLLKVLFALCSRLRALRVLTGWQVLWPSREQQSQRQQGNQNLPVQVKPYKPRGTFENVHVFEPRLHFHRLGPLLRADYLRPVRLTTSLRPPSESHMRKSRRPKVPRLRVRQGPVQQSEWAQAAGSWFAVLIVLASLHRDFGKC